MTSKAPVNGLLVAGGVGVAAAVWAAAILLPAPASRAPAPALLAAVAPAEPTAPREQAQAEPEGDAQAPAETAAAPSAQPSPVIAAPPIDPSVFGALTADMTPAIAPRVTMLEATGTVPISSLSLAATPLHSIGATFAEPLAGSQAPELGGVSPLDGPADAGLEERVERTELAEAPTAPPGPRGKIIVIDASEGTKLDPLRQRNWDLNAVQVIPPISAPATPAPRR